MRNFRIQIISFILKTDHGSAVFDLPATCKKTHLLLVCQGMHFI